MNSPTSPLVPESAAVPPSSGRRGYGRLLRSSSYLRVFSAGLGSVAGSAIAGISLVWIVATTTGSALDLAALGVAGVGSSAVFSVFGGTVVDRYDARRLMILSDVGRAIALGLLVVVLAFRGFDLAVLVGVAAAVAAFGTVFGPAEHVIVPRLVAAEDVADANGLINSTRSAVQFAGAGIGGALLFAVGPLWGVVANVATFALSATLLAGIVLPPLGAPAPGTTQGERSGYFSELAAGFRWLVGARGFFQLTLSAMVFNFCSSVIGTFLVLYSNELLHGNALTFALLLAGEVAGMGVGALLVGPARAERWAGRAWTLPYGVVSGAIALALPLFPSVPVALAVLFALGCLGGFAGTAWLTAAQKLVPTRMQGRYFGIDNLGSVVIIPAAQLGGALLIARAGLAHTYLWFGLVWVVAGAVFLVPRSLWRLGTAEAEPSSA